MELRSEHASRQAKKATRYVIVSPVRDEEEHIEGTLMSVIGQTVRPMEWIIVNDGSKDGSADIIERYAKAHSWIKAVHRGDRGQRVPGSGVIEAFYDGFQQLDSNDWEFIVKLDGDVGLDPDYFERCFQRFEEDETLGMCGGMMYCMKDGRLELESHPMFHVRGPIKLYKRACWDAIGGLVRAAGWDTIDEVQANRLGWRTRSFPEIKVIHRRPTGAVQGFWRDGIKMGRAAYICGYHPVFMMVKCGKRVFQKPYLLLSLAHAYGFLSSYFKHIPRAGGKALIRYLRQQQIRRLLLRESIWR